MSINNKKGDSIHYLKDVIMKSTHPIGLTIVGAGATGSEVARNIASMQCVLEEVGIFLKVTVCDFDTIEQHNVGKQRYSKSMIGVNKALALTSAINRFYGTDWTADLMPYQPPRSTDILVSCVDSLESKKIIGTSTYHYWMDVGNSKNHGQVVLGNNRDLETVLEIFPDAVDNKEEPSCSSIESINKQGFFINHILAGFAGTLLFDLLYKKNIVYHAWFVNLNNSVISKKPI